MSEITKENVVDECYSMICRIEAAEALAKIKELDR